MSFSICAVDPAMIAARRCYFPADPTCIVARGRPAVNREVRSGVALLPVAQEGDLLALRRDDLLGQLLELRILAVL